MAGADTDPLEPLEPDPLTVKGIADFYRDSGTIKDNVKLEGYDEKIKDFDGKEMKFFKCSYKVGPTQLSRLIKRGNPSSLNWASDYHFVSTLRHPAAVQVENYFNTECLVISEVHGSFSKWLDMKDSTELFAQGTMLPILKNMVIQLAGLVQSIIAKGKYPLGLSMKDMYIKILPDGSPKLQVLILEVKDITVLAHEDQAWKSVRDIVRQCFDRHHVNPNEGSEGFISCIGILTKNTEALLEDYPDQWDNLRKGGFLIESCAHSDKVSRRFNDAKSGLRWPVGEDEQTPPLLLELIRHSEEKSRYHEDFPYDYVKLLRNSYKHFKKVPAPIKARLGGDTDGFIRQMEEWTPRIWHILYVAVNRP